MHRLHQIPADRVGWRGVVMLAGILAISACGDRSEAACGDWLAAHTHSGSPHPTPAATVGEQQAFSLKHLQAARSPLATTLSPSRQLTAFAEPTAALPVPRGRCQGPACGQLPELPLTPNSPPDSLTPVSRLEALLCGETLIFNSTARWLLSDAEPYLTAGHPSRIERPPLRG